MYSDVIPPINNSVHIVRIGDLEFSTFNRACKLNRHCIIVQLDPKEFESLNDNALVTYRIGNPIPRATLKELYKDGEPKEIVGAKFGRLNKKIIDESKTVDRYAVEQ